MRKSKCRTNSDSQGQEYGGSLNSACHLAESGDIVVLSPASASFDMYSNFMERGNHFKEIVSRL